MKKFAQKVNCLDSCLSLAQMKVYTRIQFSVVFSWNIYLFKRLCKFSFFFLVFVFIRTEFILLQPFVKSDHFGSLWNYHCKIWDCLHSFSGWYLTMVVRFWTCRFMAFCIFIKVVVMFNGRFELIFTTS